MKIGLKKINGTPYYLYNNYNNDYIYLSKLIKSRVINNNFYGFRFIKKLL